MNWLLKIRMFWCVLALLDWGDGYVHAQSYIQVPFYSATLTLPVVPGMPLPIPAQLSTAFVQRAYTHFEACEYEPFLKKIGDYRRGMGLSDWHFYEIVARTSTLMFPSEPANFAVLFQWFVLRKSGIDARVFFSDAKIWLHAPAPDVEFGFYIIEQDGKRLVNLSAWRDHEKMEQVNAILPPVQPDGAVMDMAMQIKQLPHLVNNQTIERLIEFTHLGETLRVQVRLNRDYLAMMDDYPYYSQAHYFQVGLSYEAESSLLPALEALMDGMNTMERISLLLSFTRTSFFYLDDHHRYGKEKPMTPEQTLYHSYSDCEDRSALFFYLVRKLIHVPAIVLDFQTHVGVALALPDAAGEYIDYAGRKFIYCEPTGPQDILKIGEMWPAVKGQKSRVISEYIP
jgi:hypothetical protein